MKAMVLAAGKGERLRPLTDRLPKPMVPVAGKPLISYTLEYLKNCGVEDIVINLHHLGDEIQTYLGNGSSWGLRIHYSLEPTLLGTGGGINKAAPYLVHDTFVVMNADILLELDLREVIQFHQENSAMATMVLRKDPDVEQFGAIEVDVHGRIRQFLGKLAVPNGLRRRLMFTGVHIFEPAVFSYMPSHKSFFSIVDAYLAMIQAGERVMGYEMKGFWTDLGTPARYARFQELLEEEKISMDQFIHGCNK